ncbi:MAG: class I SAM-dependent methyltransferase [Alphaproteobacteria bacterium]|nr:methyltransferase domain-containing protein [Alphaproteobacteria bacterium]MDE2111514.1 class I SAM-dependent methyltransferase [Alphaproteobacteria bacterium]MDE2493941.1 class I SAM-dependent methyltransferase [Alphaproteobacteria bacterium]
MTTDPAAEFDPAGGMLGAYSPLDGTVEFYGRINAILQRESVVLDLGAGRGAWFCEDRCRYRRELRSIRGKVAEYVGADIDCVVLSNSTTDRNVIITDGRIPLTSASVDLIIADYVLEHIENVAQLRNEIARVLKPGGVFCARTPHALNYVSIAARMIRNVVIAHAPSVRGMPLRVKRIAVSGSMARRRAVSSTDRMSA